jgi:hypothetical protein
LGSSAEPLIPDLVYRPHQRSTVGRATPTCSAVCAFGIRATRSSALPNPPGWTVDAPSQPERSDHPHEDPTVGLHTSYIDGVLLPVEGGLLAWGRSSPDEIDI